MEIYRDTPMLRYVLDMCNLPEGAERVAIAMRDEQGGPHLVVTRAGDFVTCLGEGMHTGDLAIVRRGQLDAFSAQVDGLRVRMAEAEAMAGSSSNAGRMLGLLFTEGLALSREQFRVISVWQPMLRWEMFRLMLECHELTLRMRDTMATRDARRHPKRYLDLVDHYGRVTWAMAYLTLLVGMGPRSFFDQLPDPIAPIRRHFSWQCCRTGMSRMALLANWAVGKAGKSMLPDFKDGYREARTPQQFLCAALGLVTIGLRHQSLRAEIAKVMRVLPREEQFAADMQSMEPARALLAFHLEHPEIATEVAEPLGSEIYVKFSSHLPDDHPLRCTDPLTVPTPLAHTALSYVGLDFRRDSADLATLSYLLPWLANIEPEELFLPEPLAAHFRQPAFKKVVTDSLINNYVEYDGGNGRPIRRAAQPGRNATCACGSGAKYKRCCGRT